MSKLKEVRFSGGFYNASVERDHPPRVSPFFKVFGKFLKKIQIIENTRNIANIVLIFRICGVKVSKI
jgi:hypothetical protein